MNDFSGDLFTVDGMRKLGHYIKTVRLFKGHSRAEVTRKTGISDQWLIKFENGTYKQVPKKETLECYCKFLGIAIELQYNYNLRGADKMEKVRLEITGSGSKRTELEKTVIEALKELGINSDEYSSDPNNALDTFLSNLSRESVNDSQAVVLCNTVPTVILHEGMEAIYSDETRGAEGGLEIIVKKELISDLDNLVILLTYDDN